MTEKGKGKCVMLVLFQTYFFMILLSQDFNK